MSLDELALKVAKELDPGYAEESFGMFDPKEFAHRLVAELAKQEPVANVVLYQGNMVGALEHHLDEGTKLYAGPVIPADVKSLVNKQAADDGLWFVAQTAPEAYLQQELRKLHSLIEEGDK